MVPSDGALALARKGACGDDVHQVRTSRSGGEAFADVDASANFAAGRADAVEGAGPGKLPLTSWRRRDLWRRWQPHALRYLSRGAREGEQQKSGRVGAVGQQAMTRVGERVWSCLCLRWRSPAAGLVRRPRRQAVGQRAGRR